MTFLLSLVLVLAIVVVAFKEPIKSELNWDLSVLAKYCKIAVIPLALLGIIVFQSAFYAKPGYQYFVVSPFGTKNAIMTEGVKFICPGSTVQTWPKFVDVKAIDRKEVKKEDIEDIEGVMKPIPFRFIDQVTATAYPSVRYQMPSVKQDFISLAVEFRTLKNLVENTLVPATREQLVNTGYMFAAQDYISGEAQNFRQTFEEQLMEGAYKVEKYEVRDTVYSSIKVKGPREIKQIQTSYRVEKILENGVPARVANEIAENKITVAQVILEDIKLEDAFKLRLEAQRDESAKRQLEQQKIKTAKDAQARIIAEGERDKAAERADQERKQVKELIAIETRLKKEETNRQLAKIALETEKLNSEKEKVAANARAYKNQKLVQAGLSPQDRKDMAIQMNKDKWENIAKIKLPTTVVTGQNGKGSDGLLSTLLGAEIAKSMNKTK